jgi:predicted nucleic acid-binding protein
LIRTIFKRIETIDADLISSNSWEKAFNYTKDVDENDTPFVALCLDLESPLWTGDKKLAEGLKQKRIDWIYDTEKLKLLRDIF